MPGDGKNVDAASIHVSPPCLRVGQDGEMPLAWWVWLVLGSALAVLALVLPVPSGIVRAVLAVIPLPGRFLAPLLRVLGRRVRYPAAPAAIRLARWGIRIEIRQYTDLIQRHLYFLGYFELREARFVRSILREGDRVIDVGANIGWYTLLAARAVGPAGHVIAFEPASAAHDHLQSNIALNGFTNVEVLKIGLSSAPRRLQLVYPDTDNAGAARLIETTGAGTGETVEVRRFDAFWDAALRGPIRLIKIDVEGAELDVLEGMSGILRRGIADYVMIELDDDRLREQGRSAAEGLDQLAAAGYTLWIPTLRGLSPLDRRQPVRLINVIAQRKGAGSPMLAESTGA